MAQLQLNIEQALIEGANAVIDFLIEKYDALGMRASGEWADSLEYEITDRGVIIKGMDYTVYLTQGRPPGGNPPASVIYQWMHDKKTFSGEKTWQRAYAISQSIGKKGTSWYQKGGSDLVEVLLDPEIRRLFFGKIQEVITVQVADNMLSTIQEVDYSEI